MIGSLRGTLLERAATGEVLVEVAGVGYRALVSPAAVAAVGEPGAEVFLHTHLHVREDALTLYGFPSRDERACFEALIGAHGVGPALALAILSVHRPDALRWAVADDDVDALCLVPGVGKKTAARLLIELKARLDLPDGDLATMVGAVAGAADDPPAVAPARAEVRAALASLGYGPDEIRDAVRDLPADGDVALLLKSALTTLSTVR
ncbi:MAG TPA: Holliday junction branch migration protein RuvA [Acidimicrobiales bacterium]|nr:Holliday junction branch migration protein RuvA [Acidimicrobiales bacterium]